MLQGVVCNPMYVKRSKELEDNPPTKNDAKDALVIARLVKDSTRFLGVRSTFPSNPAGRQSQDNLNL